MTRIELETLDVYNPGASAGRVGAAQAARLPGLATPELGNGFVYLPCTEGESAREPEDLYSCRIELPRQGNYRVRLAVREQPGAARWQVFAQNRRLMHLAPGGAASEADRVLTFAVNLCDIVPDQPGGAPGARQKKTALALTVTGRGVRPLWVEIEEAEIPTLHLAGDSTVTDQGADLPYWPGVSYCGWGQILPALLDDSIAVNNQSHGGMTVASFRERGHWAILKEALRPGDIVLVQFGHNDQKLHELRAGEGYADGLRAYVAEIRAAGATPVFVTSLARNSWRPDGAYNDLLLPYVQAMKAVAAKQEVPVLDLHAAFGGLLCKLGREKAKALFYPGDFTHTNDYGGHAATRLLCEAIAASTGPALQPLRDALQSSTPPWQPTGSEAEGITHGWLAPPPAKVPAWLAEDGEDETVSRLCALELTCRAFSYFSAVGNIPAGSGGGKEEPAPVLAAKQNGYWPDGLVADAQWLAAPVVAGELKALLVEACKGRAPVPMEALDALPPPRRQGRVTRAEAAAMAGFLEHACLGVEESAAISGIEMQGS